jgi:chaperonin GroES
MKRILRPIGDRLVLRPVSAEEMERLEKDEATTSLLFKPETAKERPMVGDVIDTGPLVKQIARKDRVLYGKYSGNEVTLNGEQLLILHESEVFSIVVEDSSE